MMDNPAIFFLPGSKVPIKRYTDESTTTKTTTSRRSPTHRHVTSPTTKKTAMPLSHLHISVDPHSPRQTSVELASLQSVESKEDKKLIPNNDTKMPITSVVSDTEATAIAPTPVINIPAKKKSTRIKGWSEIERLTQSFNNKGRSEGGTPMKKPVQITESKRVAKPKVNNKVISGDELPQVLTSELVKKRLTNYLKSGTATVHTMAACECGYRVYRRVSCVCK